MTDTQPPTDPRESVRLAIAELNGFPSKYTLDMSEQAGNKLRVIELLWQDAREISESLEPVLAALPDHLGDDEPCGVCGRLFTSVVHECCEEAPRLRRELSRLQAGADAVHLTPADQPGDEEKIIGVPVGSPAYQLINEQTATIEDQAAELATLRAENEQLHTWDGLMSVLDEHYPHDVFDGSSGDEGPRTVVLARALAQARDHADSGAARITAERQRQITAEGWTPEHDQQHTHGELVAAAIFYADDTKPHTWPWGNPPKRRGRVRDLERAGALIAAEIDRLAQARDQTRGRV